MADEDKDLYYKYGELKGRVDSIQSTQDRMRDDMDKRFDKLDTSMQRIETSVNTLKESLSVSNTQIKTSYLTIIKIGALIAGSLGFIHLILEIVNR